MSDYPSDLDHDVLPPSDEDDGELLEKFQTWFRIDRDHSFEWRKEARECYDFVAGRQWSQEESAMLKEKMRPDMSFNRIGPMVKIVMGLESANRQETHYLPRKIGDSAVDELLSAAAKWTRDECDAEDEESDAFADLVIGGMGWTDSVLKYDENPDGELKIERADSMEMFWDAGAKRKNLGDAQRLFRVKDLSIEEARELFPKASIEELNAGWAVDLEADADDPHDAQQAPYYRNDQSGKLDRARSMVRLVEVQWWEHRTAYRVLDPFSGEVIELDEGSLNLLNDRLRQMGMDEPMSVKQRKRFYRRAFVGSSILQVWDGPAKGGFTWKCMTGERDRNKGTWYGIVRAMIDPQKWANKWMSQSLHILNTGAKGGIMAEADAFEDIREAEEDWAHPDAIVLTAPGAISGGKIQPRPPNQMPPGLSDLLQLAISSIRDCTGINLELLGMVEKEQPGILEHMRKQAGMTVLAGLFDALRRYRKEHGRLLLWFITNFLSDGRLIRIGGPDQAKYVPLIHQPGTVEYDVIVDDTPTSPNLKEQTWAVLMQMAPMMSRMPIPPQVWMELLKYSPLPATVVTKIEKIIQSAPPPPNTQAIAAQSAAKLNEARGQFYAAQAQKIGMDAQMGSHQAQAEHERTQMEGAKTMMEAEEVKARIENLRSAAMLNMAKAGVVQKDAHTDQMLAVLEMLDSVVGWHQDNQAMQMQHQQAMQQPVAA